MKQYIDTTEIFLQINHIESKLDEIAKELKKIKETRNVINKLPDYIDTLNKYYDEAEEKIHMIIVKFKEINRLINYSFNNELESRQKDIIKNFEEIYEYLNLKV